MSRAERFALAGSLLLVVMQVGAAWLPSLAGVLEYRRAALVAQPWRLLSAHWVHINAAHVLVNAAAWFVVARLFARELTPARQLLALAVSGAAISAGLAAAYPAIEWYRGFSGILHALYFAGATMWLATAVRQTRNWRELWLPLALWVGGTVKVVVEQPGPRASTYAEWLGAPTVPQAHLLGAACGVALGIAFLLARRSGAAAKAGG